MTVDSKYNAFNTTFCGPATTISMSQDGTTAISVTTCFSPVQSLALLNEDTTPIRNEDNTVILTE